jgi:hypothetical protein
VDEILSGVEKRLQPSLEHLDAWPFGKGFLGELE